MKKPNRVLLVGWDAADWKMIHPLMDAGKMPNLQKLVENGVSGNLTTLSPVLSPMLWTSIATGKHPYKHGIWGFSEPTPDRSGIQPISNLNRTTKAIWNILNQNDKKSLVVGWWPSHPAEPINGVMISNHYHRAPKSADLRWPMQPGTVHPPELAEELAEIRFHPAELEPKEILSFIPEAEKVDQETDQRIDTCARNIADATSIHCAATHLMETQPWDFAAVYFDAIDHFSHAFMKYHPPQQSGVSDTDFGIYQHVVSAGYMYHDMMLGQLVELAGKETTVMVISDHGFHPDNLRPTNMPIEPAGPAIEHRDLGIFVACGPGIQKDAPVHGATLLDITPTILTLFDLPIGEDMDGHPITEIFKSAPTVETVESWDDIEGLDGRHPPDLKMDVATSKEALEQLVALGYVDRPSDEMSVAVAETERELNYNLALSYMDAGMHPKAAELLSGLYTSYPLEFRFGVRLALCLQVMELPDQMASVVNHLDTTWRIAAKGAAKKLKAFQETLEERKLEAEQESKETKGASLVKEHEKPVVRQLRGIARGNPQTLDYLFSGIAIAQGDHETALAHLVTAKNSTTRSAGFHLQVGNAYLELGRLAEAEASFNDAIHLDPENPKAFMGLARVALKMRKDDLALKASSKSLGLKFHNPAAHYFHGMAQYNKGQYDKAVASLEKAIELNPNFPEAHTRLVSIFTKKIPDTVRASLHRGARNLIKKQSKTAAQPLALNLAFLDEAEIEKILPEFTDPPLSKLKRPLGAAPEKAAKIDGPFVTVVSGLPRSGTSMAMQMLAAGGAQILTDDERAADESNPRGYLELDRIKGLMRENDWLDEARGQAVKVVAPLIPYLPQDCDYRVILMDRPAKEVAASQTRMLGRLENPSTQNDEEAATEVLEQQFAAAQAVMKAHHVPILLLSYRDVVADPPDAAQKMAEFLDLELDLAAMAASVDALLWRERRD